MHYLISTLCIDMYVSIWTKIYIDLLKCLYIVSMYQTKCILISHLIYCIYLDL